MAGVQTVRLAPAFMGEQATYGPSYHGGLAPPPEWWLQFVHVFTPCQLAQLQQSYNNTWAQPCHWPAHQSTYPVNPTPCYFTPTAFTHQPPFCPAPLPLHIHQPFPQPPPASHAQPSPIQRPVATPTQACSPNPIPPSTSTPAQPLWADLSEDVNPTPCYFTPTAFTHQPPLCPAPLPLHIHQPFPHPPPASHAQPSPIQRPVGTPTQACSPNPIPPSTSTPAKPSWADLSEEFAPANQVDELPTLLPKPNKGKGKGKSKSNKKPKGSGKGNKHRNGFNNPWNYDYDDSYWY